MRRIILAAGLSFLVLAFLSLGADVYWSVKSWHPTFQPLGAYWFGLNPAGLAAVTEWLSSTLGAGGRRVFTAALGFPATAVAFTFAFGLLLAAGRRTRSAGP